jgi:hypothetical protein
MVRVGVWFFAQRMRTSPRLISVTGTDCCSGVGEVFVQVQACNISVPEHAANIAVASPVPVPSGQALRIQGAKANDLLSFVAADGRLMPLRITDRNGAVEVRTEDLAPGVYTLLVREGRSLRVVVE